MKVAIINQYSSAGGGSRFLRALVSALAKNYPNLEIGLFVDINAIERDDLKGLFSKNNNVKIFPLNKGNKESDISNDLQIKKNSIKENLKKVLKKNAFITKIGQFFKFKILGKEGLWCKFQLNKEAIDELNNYDVVYLAWPYFIEPVKLTSPVVATFHDFNFKYDYGNFDEVALKILDRQVSAWLKICRVVTSSTPFIQKEMEKFYPGIAKDKKVIFLSTFKITNPGEEDIQKVVKKFNLPKDYILCPSNTSLHKNLKNLLMAYGELKKQNFKIPLVLVGFGTDDINLFRRNGFSKNDPRYNYFKALNKIIDDGKLKPGKDIKLLGYVTDEEVDALISGARLVLSPSLYEAGSGPGLDAWKTGTPVAFSDIPPFLEQLNFLGTKAWIFDPKNPQDIAQKINQAIIQKAKSLAMVQESKRAIDKYTWDKVAKGYHKVFEEAVRRRKN